MKTKLLTLIACLFLVNGAQAQTLMHYWNFNRLAPAITHPVPADSLPPIQADYTDTTLIGHSGAIFYRDSVGATATDSTYYDSIIGNSINAQLGSPAGYALKLRNPSTQAETRIYVPSDGYKDVIFGFGGKTNNGNNVLHLSYSIDSGAHWLTSGIKTINGSSTNTADTIFLFNTPALGIVTFDSTVNNKSGFVIRMRFSGGTSDPNGYNVLDNVSLMGTPYKLSVREINMPNSAPTIYPNPASASITINTLNGNEKKINIYNTAGQIVYRSVNSAQHVMVPIEKTTGRHILCVYL